MTNAITNNETMVLAAERCPNCEEQRMDWLIWDDDGWEVKCHTCGTVYTP